MSASAVQSALIQAVKTKLDALSLPTAYENMTFDRPDGAWAQVFFLPNQPVVETLGSAGSDFLDGLLQVDLNYPTGQGDSAARAAYESIRDAFPAGSRLSYNGQEVVIRNCGRSSGRVVDGCFRINITIVWYALIPR